MLVGAGRWQEGSALCHVDLTTALLMCPQDKIPASPEGTGPGQWGPVTTSVTCALLEACH